MANFEYPSKRLEAVLAWADVPTTILEAELLRRRQDGGSSTPACGSQSGRDHYNTSLHVAALILILALSTLACSFPIVVRRFPSLPVPHRFLFLSRHFGTGVLIATAFVHLLPTAFTSLNDPCLPRFWNKSYPAMPGLIAMSSVLVVVGIEMFFATRGAGHIHSADLTALSASANDSQTPAHQIREGHVRGNSFRSFGYLEAQRSHDGGPANVRTSTDSHSRNTGSQHASHRVWDSQTSLAGGNRGGEGEDSAEDSDLELDELDYIPDQSHLLKRPVGQGNGHVSAASSAELPTTPQAPFAADPQQQKLLLQCLLLEAGILFHSVFIGMALSVATGTSFIVLLIAISFHQTFEGLALGSRISAIRFPARSPKPWLMALAYGTTTPIGQAIGLMIHNMYDPASQTGLLMVGTMNAISSGLLLFAGLVELLAEDFLSDESYQTLTGTKRIQACAAVVGGAALMALTGAWA